MSSTISRGFGLVAAIVVAVTVAPATATAATPTLTWRPCPADVAAPRLRCAGLEVPLDYRRPDGEKIEVAVSRLPSTNPERRRGVLLMNPGGPGPGLGMPLSLVQRGLPASVTDSYDLIGFDPRGLGHSTRVTCDLKPLRDPQPPYARDAADVAKHARIAEAVAKGCATSKTAPLLPYITTANIARDVDAIRAALGERRISSYGVSYGTYLGAVYATLFPHRTDRVVLDGVTGPGGLDITGSRRFGQGFQDRFPDFARWAAAHDDSYALGSTPRQVTGKYHELAARLDRTPVGEIDGVAFRDYTFNGLYADQVFPELARLWQSLDRGRPPASPGPLSTGTGDDTENLLAAPLLVRCNDTAWPRSVGTYQHHVAVDRERFPLYGAAAANIWPCAFWPSRPIEPPVRIGDRGPSNILLVQNRRDPAAPLAGAGETRRALGDRARMVTVDQGGHGVYLSSAEACGNDAVTRFLLTGQRPATDFPCGPSATPDR
ncbi:alpha/beta hydrolase [Amycolatopsis samaneae]|uniref:Alpha/beta hydrolase n=1 Tax=Amycolatopsis samaneae TaxID=664691 RepID=A0ABW5GMA6_9PSEU